MTVVLPVNKENVFLTDTPDGLTLTGEGGQIRGDFAKMLPRLKEANLRGEMLVKAARLKKTDREPLVLDATAGLGEDSLLLAAAGYRVELYERDQVMAALLSDAMQRGREDPGLSQILSRMHLNCEDSILAMRQMAGRAQETPDAVPDIILLDPMFPARTKSALVKKKFQLIHQLEQPCEEEEELLKAAMDVRPKKVIIKRPLKGPCLGGVKPSYSLKGKSVRYDCIVL